MSLAENLQYLRAREGVTQEQLAERLDVSRQSVSKWESAASFPAMASFSMTADAPFKMCCCSMTGIPPPPQAMTT